MTARLAQLEALTALWSVARHSAALAELVATLDDDVMAGVVAALLDHKEAVRHAAALLVRDLSKRTLQLSQLAVDAGAGSALAQLLKDTPGPCRLHAAVALGYIAAHSPVLALAVIAAQVVEGLVAVLREDDDEAVLEAAAWTLGQLGRHSAKHVEEIAGQHVLTTLAEVRPGTKD
ncbi:sperm-associated antigen 6-like [Frankliniella occidentalis]|uniref:Sperm-associated antigen 6-like n=1 Tax=Frankliniella occidentalis TaxID=133901 RepID=A0A6J1TJ79_FRAOC|nr:sperm-associated antigen 6-like [Frankliniella occidentalis]